MLSIKYFRVTDLFELIDAEVTSFDLLKSIFKSHLDASLEPRIIRAAGEFQTTGSSLLKNFGRLEFRNKQ